MLLPDQAELRRLVGSVDLAGFAASSAAFAVALVAPFAPRAGGCLCMYLPVGRFRRTYYFLSLMGL